MKINSTDKPKRFLNRSLLEIAIKNNWRYTEAFGGWLIEIAHGENKVRAYGYQFSLNSAVSAAIAKDKASCAAFLIKDKIPCIETWLILDDIRQAWIDGRSADEVAQNIIACLRPPLVVKPNEGSSGRDILLCDTQEEALYAIRKLLKTETSVAVQLLANIQSEERHIIVNGVPVLQYIKSRGPGLQDKLIQFNLSTGATVTLPPTDGFKGTALALEAAKSLGLSVAAVDVIAEQNGNIRIIEVNSGLSFEHFVTFGIEYERRAKSAYEQIIRIGLTAEIC